MLQNCSKENFSAVILSSLFHILVQGQSPFETKGHPVLLFTSTKVNGAFNFLLLACVLLSTLCRNFYLSARSIFFPAVGRTVRNFVTLVQPQVHHLK
jgi:hypothetical protein